MARLSQISVGSVEIGMPANGTLSRTIQQFEYWDMSTQTPKALSILH